MQLISARRWVVVKPRLEGGRGQWTRDEVSLADLASQSRHGVQLGLGFDAFGDDPHIQVGAEGGNASEQGSRSAGRLVFGQS